MDNSLDSGISGHWAAALHLAQQAAGGRLAPDADAAGCQRAADLQHAAAV